MAGGQGRRPGLFQPQGPHALRLDSPGGGPGWWRCSRPATLWRTGGPIPWPSVPRRTSSCPPWAGDDDVLGLLETHGLEPKIAFTTLDTVSALAMIQNDLGMSIMMNSSPKAGRGKVAILPLDPPQQLTLGVAVPSLPRAAPAVKAFLQFAVQALTQGQAEG